MTPSPPASPPVERIGVLLVHGIGEQRSFEHLEAEVRHLLRAIREQVCSGDSRCRVTLEIRTTQDGVYLGERENWRAEGCAPISIDVHYADDRRSQCFEFREVWWADLDEPASLWNALRFWSWGLSLWARPVFDNPPAPGETRATVKGKTDTLPGSRLMIPPGTGAIGDGNDNRPPKTAFVTRVHLFFSAFIFILILGTLIPINWILKKLTFIRIRPADILMRYLADVKLYQQAKRRDLWPLLDMGSPPRVMIRRRMIRAMTDIALADYDRWYILSHSLGTVVACNGLMETAHSLPNYLDRERWQRVLESELGGLLRLADGDETGSTTNDMMPARPGWVNDRHVMYRNRLFSKFRGILTYGSPLDKFAALFPATVPLNPNGAVFQKGTQWINIHDPTDPVGADLNFFTPPPSAKRARLEGLQAIEPENHAYCASFLLLYSHICYMKFKPDKPHVLVNKVADWLLQGAEFPAPPPGSSQGWPAEPAARLRKHWRLAQDLIVIALATLLLVWLFNPLLRELFEMLAGFDNVFGDWIGKPLLALHSSVTAMIVNGLRVLLPGWPLLIGKALFYLVLAALLALLAGIPFLVIGWIRALREKMRDGGM